MMSPLWQFLAALVVAIISALLSPPIVLWALKWKNRKETAARAQREREQREEDARRERERETWMRDSENAFKRVENDCAKCNQKLERYTTAFYMVLEELEDEIIQMLPENSREVVRVMVRKARIATRDPLEWPTTWPPDKAPQ